MKVLISAVACAPGTGSEGAVGWRAVRNIAQRHEVRLLTHVRFRKAWEAAAASGELPSDFQVRFLGEEKPWHPNRLIGRLQSWLRFVEFNRQVYDAALAWHAEEPVDLAHHVTYATWRVPSQLWKLPVPFVWGPIAGAGYMPRRFRGTMGFSARMFETARDLNSALALRSKAFLRCVRNSAVVIAATRETEDFLRPFRGDCPLLRVPVTYLEEESIRRFRRSRGPRRPGPIRLFAGGNMIGSKGLAIAVRALAEVKKAGITFIYTIAGGGPEIPRIEALVKQLGLEREIIFHPGYQGEGYVRVLQETDVYLLPSFREALGLSMVEAALAGCYPVVLDLSMPSELVNVAGGFAAKVTDIKDVARQIKDQIIRLNGRIAEIAREAESIGDRIARWLSQENYGEKIDLAYEMALGVASETKYRRFAGSMPNEGDA